MNKFLVFLIIFMLAPVLIFSQEKKDEDRQTITLCWTTSLDTAAIYLIYFNRYNTSDTAWRLIGTTKEKTFTINKQALKGDIAFGVKSVYYSDTSLLHKSLDETACSDPNTNCDENCTTGPWYITWHIRKPEHIGLQ